ncbi:uncharacterized protein LOC130143697 isoform X2 [Falco biarmicus]|uniref:uncharacterized protein LOC130143697 isoform X2 n=1 Tax=Falco biarmicus TaxID=345155 RepID=UPI0024BCD30D|nr:uncharacterized protein LOC130143697 isoform X2 [Falco biarmicus]
MAWLPLLLAVLAHGTGSLVQAALTQPPSLSANPGQTIQITCSGEDSNYYGWYQQKAPGTGPVTVIYGSKGPSGIPLRFSGSLPSSTGTLTIAGVQAEDEAIYYCGAPHGSADEHAGALQGGRAWVLWVHCCCLWCTGGSNADGAAEDASGRAPGTAELWCSLLLLPANYLVLWSCGLEKLGQTLLLSLGIPLWSLAPCQFRGDAHPPLMTNGASGPCVYGRGPPL